MKNNNLRIVGGFWRRHLLPIVSIEGLRPTPDRVRETLFNWLGQDCSGMAVLDLYAGTGALGFEAASRGAEHVALVESHREVVAQLQENRLHLLSKWDKSEGLPPQIQIYASDALSFLKNQGRAGKSFDLVFLDPPFQSDLLHTTLPLINQVLKPNGLIYAEWNQNLFADEAVLSKWLNVSKIDILRHLKAGQVHAHLFTLPAL